MGAEHGANRDRTTWREDREQEASELGVTEQPYVLIVGGGQAGIGLAARLRQLSRPASPPRSTVSSRSTTAAEP